MTQPPVPPPPEQPVVPGQPVPPPFYPQYGPAPQYGPPPKPTSTGKVLLIVGGIITGAVVLLCIGAVTLGLADSQSAKAAIRVEVTSCQFTDGLLPSATVGYTVTNGGKSAKSVRLKIEYRDSGGARIDTDTAYVRTIAPGDTVRDEETTLLSMPVSGGTCEIVDVS